jgi:hypothetical protein
MQGSSSVLMRHDIVEDVLSAWSRTLGRDGPGYRGHVYRVLNFALALAGEASAPGDIDGLATALVFHDLGIWSDHTLDYLEQSAARARAYMATHLPAANSEAITQMIMLHHKVTPCPPDASPLAEAVRRADLVDLSLGMVRFGLAKEFVREVRAVLPNEGFHSSLARIWAGWIIRHPTRPLPMFRA